MAVNKNKREVRYALNDDDYNAFGRYRIMYTTQGRRMVNRQRLTYIISGAAIAILFTVFHVDPNFTKLAYIVAAVIGIGGALFAEKILLRQQGNAINKEASSPERVHPTENIVRFGDESFETQAGEAQETFRYSDIKLIDLTEEAIYVWISDEQIMPVPLHAFRNMDEMKDYYKWIRAKIKEQGGSVGDDEE